MTGVWLLLSPSEYYKNNLTLANKYAYLAYKSDNNSVDDRLECLELIIRNIPAMKPKNIRCNTFISTTA
jgi:hypothetical protein